MNPLLQELIDKLADGSLNNLSVIPFASPIIAFGDYKTSIIATMGLNPSDREFLDTSGKELNGKSRRFHTLGSLGLKKWTYASPVHISLIESSCKNYFLNNPYNIWFRDMEIILSETGYSLYKSGACHLDLIPFATSLKWANLSSNKKNSLLALSKISLENVLVNSKIKLIVLNGRSVVESFEKMANINFKTQVMPEWTLSRKNSKPVKGVSFKANLSNANIINLNRDITILGYNHNLQSCFGVSSEVKNSIKKWVAKSFKESQ